MATSGIDRIQFNPAARPVDTIGIDTSFQRMAAPVNTAEQIQAPTPPTPPQRPQDTTGDTGPAVSRDQQQQKKHEALAGKPAGVFHIQQKEIVMTEQSTAAAWSIWSDGSSLGNPGPAGWAILVRRPDGTSYTVLGNSQPGETRTNNEAEMFALLQATKAIPADQVGIVYSDSSYAINASTAWRAKWEKNGMKTAKRKPIENQGLIRKLWDALDARPGVTLEHVMGHSGIPENETTDQLARWAAEQAKAGNSIERRVRELVAA